MAQEIIRIDLQGVNCYLAKVGDEFILFDTGGPMVLDKTYTDRHTELENVLESAGCKPGSLKLVVLTHGDYDHVANAVFIREKYHARIAMHPGDVELVNNPAFEKVMGSFNYRPLLFRLVFRIMKQTIAKTIRQILAKLKSFQPDILLGEGDFLQEYGLEATILHIPGHTAGSIAILTAEGALICGDTFANFNKPGPA